MEGTSSSATDYSSLSGHTAHRPSDPSLGTTTLAWLLSMLSLRLQGVARGKADEQQQSYCMLYAACRLLHAAFTPMLDAAARGRGRRAAEAALFGESFRPQHQVCVHEYRRLHRQHTEHLVNSTASSSLGDPTPKHWRAASRNALQCTVLITWQHGTACNRNNPTAQAF